LSFIVGIGLYGSVYLMPFFLAYVRGHGALAIGQIMLVTGAAQLISAPITVWLEQRLGARILTAVGFAMFATGLAMSAFETPRTDYAEMFWPQAVRGFASVLCLLPPIRIALGHFPIERVPDASALFNLMRNLGGAIGLALIDTVIFGRAEGHSRALTERLLSGDTAAAEFVGLPNLPDPMLMGPDGLELMRLAVEKAGLTLAINEAWAMTAGFTAAGVLLSLAARKIVAKAQSSP
jgi:DHA2 family multidrug resistance protein